MTVIDNSKIPLNAIKVCKILTSKHKEAYLVGGCVRDLILGLEPHDFDIATNASPIEVQEIFKTPVGEKYPKTYPTGIEHGTITVALGPNAEKDHFEVTTYRSEGKYSDGRRPEKVYFEQDIGEDLKRRDLTINAMAYDPINNKIIDPYGGIADLEHKTVRAVGSADERFKEDGLRSMRAARFAAKFGFTLDPDTKNAIKNNLDILAKVSKERIRDEIVKTLKTNDPSGGIKVLLDTGIINLLSDRLSSNPRLLENISKLNICSKDGNLRLAALFYGMNVADVNSVMKELKFSNDECLNVQLLLDSIYQFEKISNKNEINNILLKLKSIKKDSKDSIEDIKLWESSTLKDIIDLGKCLGVANIEMLGQAKSPISMKEMNFTGADLQTLGVPPGKIFGSILKDLHTEIVNGLLENDKRILIERALQLFESSKKQAKRTNRLIMLKIAAGENFWTLSPEDRTKFLKNIYDFGELGKFEAGELPYIKNMVDVPAGPILHHPEGNQAIHNWLVYNESRKLSQDPKDWFAAALHDLGKVKTDPKTWPKQHGHEQAGVKPVEELSSLLHAPEDWKDVARLMAEHHLKGHTAKELRPSTLSNFFSLFKNEEDFNTFLNTINADYKGRWKNEVYDHPNIPFLKEKRINWLNKPNKIELNKLNKIELNVSAQELMKELNIPGGPKLGQIISALKKYIEENPSLNEKNKLLDEARKLL